MFSLVETIKHNPTTNLWAESDNIRIPGKIFLDTLLQKECFYLPFVPTAVLWRVL